MSFSNIKTSMVGFKNAMWREVPDDILQLYSFLDSYKRMEDTLKKSQSLMITFRLVMIKLSNQANSNQDIAPRLAALNQKMLLLQNKVSRQSISSLLITVFGKSASLLFVVFGTMQEAMSEYLKQKNKAENSKIVESLDLPAVLLLSFSTGCALFFE